MTENLPATPNRLWLDFRSLPKDEKVKHLAAISIQVTAILSQFWTPDDPHEIRSAVLDGWLDVLGQLEVEEVRAAWAEYQRSGPRSAAGRLAKPDAGALYRIIMADRTRRRERAERAEEEARMAEIDRKMLGGEE